MRWRGKAVSAAVTVALAAVTGGATGAISANAGTPETINCVAGATTDTVHLVGSVYQWDVNGIGTCFDAAPHAQQLVTLAGRGTSLGLGACSPEGTVANLAINITATFTDTVSHVVRVKHYIFGSPQTTYPISTPFNVTDTLFNPLGGGVLFTHIFAKCPPGGTSSSNLQWSQSF